MDWVKGPGRQWFDGLLLLSRVAFVLVIGGLVAAAPLWVAGDLLGLRPSWWADWTFYLSPLWAPFWMGYLRGEEGKAG